MADAFIGEIRVFTGNYAPRGWAYCDGQLMEISENQALFSIISDMYGGNGRTNFALPNLQGRVPLHFGQAPGLSYYRMAEQGGVNGVVLSDNEMPKHQHDFRAAFIRTKGTEDPTNNALGNYRYPLFANNPPVTTNVAMYGGSLDNAGGGQGHENRQPYLVFSFIICIDGEYPRRS